jgi:hypothetical protein
MKCTTKTLVLVGILVSLFGLEAQASVITYALNNSNINTTKIPDNSATPYVTVTIQDGQTFGGDNGGAVKFTVDANNSLGSRLSGEIKISDELP